MNEKYIFDLIDNNKEINIDNLDIDIINKYFETKTNSNINQQIHNTCCCNSVNIIDDYILGINVCSNCGQVIDNIFDHKPEWHLYEDDDGNTVGRCGQITNKLLPLSSLGTRFIGNKYSKLRKLHIWNSVPYKERSLNNVFKIIIEKCDTNNIKKNIQEDAKIMYKNINESKHLDGKNKDKNIITRGNNRKGIIAACVFFACKRNNCSRTQKEIANIFSLKHAEISKGCKKMSKLINNNKFDLNIGSCDSSQFIIRYCNKQIPKIKSEFCDQAVIIAKNIERLNIASEHTPFSIGATSVFIMCELNNIKLMTKKKIAERFNVSEVTIGKTYKKIEKYKHILSNNDDVDIFLNKIQLENNNIIISDVVLERMKKFGVDINND